MPSRCSHCKRPTDKNDFYSKADSWCKECKREYIASYQKQNRHIIDKSRKKYVLESPEKVKASKARYREKNREKLREKGRLYLKNNKAAVLAKCREYQCKKINATPKWLSKEQRLEIKNMYLNRPAGYHVDHIIPLRAKNVSGLHVPWNLQYLSSAENYKKSNKVTNKS